RLRRPSLSAVQRFGPPDKEYPKLTFRKEQLREDRHLDAELLSPGHALFAAATDEMEEQLAHARQASAGFVDPFAAAAYRLYFFELRVMEEIPSGPMGATRPILAYAELAAVLEN